MISFEGGGRRLTARLIGAEFIRYQSRFPTSFEAAAELAAGPFLEAVRRVSLVADRVSPVQLAFRRDVVVIEARSDGRARAVESVPVTFRGTDQVISFNPQYLLDGIIAAALSGQGRPAGAVDPGDVAAGAGRIRLEFTSPAKPALISWIGGEAVGGAAGDRQPSADSARLAKPGAASAAAASDMPGVREHRDSAPADSAAALATPRGGDRGPADATPFRYLVVPLRVPVAG